MGKEMEGDNRERRKKAREARKEGKQPSAEGVTLGASKERQHQPRSGDPEEKRETLQQGKQGGDVQTRMPKDYEPRPKEYRPRPGEEEED